MKNKLLSAFIAAGLAATPLVASADVTATVTAKVDHYQQTRAFKGAVVVLVDHGSYYYYNYGWRSDTDGISVTTPILIASNTKPFVATTLALADRYSSIPKDLELGDVIAMLPNSPPEHATLEDLVDMWSGLPRDLPTEPTNRDSLFHTLSVCSTYADACVAPEVGNPVYSNYGFQILGNILASLEGYAAWPALAHDQIMAPLGMTKTCVRGEGCHPNFATQYAHAFAFDGTEVALPDYNDISSPAGGIWTTGEDIAIWLRYQLGQIPSTSPALTRLNAVLPEMRSALPSGFGWSWRFSNLTFGDGLPHKVRWKDGHYRGLSTYVGIADSQQTAVFVFVNRDGSDPSIEKPADVLRQELGEKILTRFW